MKTAVMYGAGNIGRGFIGALLAQSGYAVTFVDIAEEVVDRLRAEKRYTVRVVEADGWEDLDITGVDAVNGRDADAVAEAIARADILATSVGANVLPHIVPHIAAGLRMRWARSGRPLNILICENLMDAGHILRKMLGDCLEPEEHSLLDERVGLVEASIGRMVPVQTPQMRQGDPLRVCVERYGFLPVDKDAFKGNIPDIERMIPFSPFDFYLRRKMYLHNMTHAVCAYLGMRVGLETIWEAVEEPSIRLIAKEAMYESMAALSEEYGVSMRNMLSHADDLLFRFANRALGDTCDRVGRDPARKLGACDRFVGAARLCEKHGILPAHIAAGAAGTLWRHLDEKGLPQTKEIAASALGEIAGLGPEDALGGWILELYDVCRQDTSPARLRKAAEAMKRRGLGEIV